jgi:hypothetical protein
MRLKAAYFIKRFLIVTLAIVLFACVGIAPDQPVLFTIASAACIIVIRFIWRSALKDEKVIKKRQIQLTKRSRKQPQDLKQAA